MKKTYNAPNINVTVIKTVMMAGSLGMDETALDNFNSARSRYNGIEWLDDEDEQ